MRRSACADGAAEGLSQREAEAVARWRRAIIERRDRGDGPSRRGLEHHVGARRLAALRPRQLSARPGRAASRTSSSSSRRSAKRSLQHFIYLERPDGSTERDGEGFEPELTFRRGVDLARSTPMPLDYETVGAFYAHARSSACALSSRSIGEGVAFCGDPALQLSPAELALKGAEPVICTKTALAALRAIVEQGEGAPADSAGLALSAFHRDPRGARAR